PVRPCRHARRPYPRWGRCRGGASLAALHERLVENRVAPLVAGRIVALGALWDGLERVVRVVHGRMLSERRSDSWAVIGHGGSPGTARPSARQPTRQQKQRPG